MLRTSETHPLQIGTLNVLNGQLGLTFCPGKKQATSLTGGWDRNVNTDVEALCSWGADTVISLLEDHEYRELQVADLPGELNYAFVWFDMPIADKGVPDATWLSDWNRKVKWEIIRELGIGNHVVVHCKGGFGRTGVVAAMILMDCLHCSAEEAITMCRAVREGAVENEEQFNFLKEYERDHTNKR